MAAASPSSSSSSAAGAAQQFNKHSSSSSNKSKKIDALAGLLKNSGSSLSRLKQIHAAILRSRLHGNNSLASLLLSLYSSFSLLPSSLSVLASVPSPNLSLFNHAVRCLSKSPPHSHVALRLYLRMTRLSIKPDNFTFPFLLNSCASLSLLSIGAELHCRLAKTGFFAYIPVANALVDMYGKCGSLALSRQAFDEMLLRDVISYNAVLGAHARLGEEMPSARKVFDGMSERNVITWNAMVVFLCSGLWIIPRPTAIANSSRSWRHSDNHHSSNPSPATFQPLPSLRLSSPFGESLPAQNPSRPFLSRPQHHHNRRPPTLPPPSNPKLKAKKGNGSTHLLTDPDTAPILSPLPSIIFP